MDNLWITYALASLNSVVAFWSHTMEIPLPTGTITQADKLELVNGNGKVARGFLTPYISTCEWGCISNPMLQKKPELWKIASYSELYIALPLKMVMFQMCLSVYQRVNHYQSVLTQCYCEFITSIPIDPYKVGPPNAISWFINPMNTIVYYSYIYIYIYIY